MNTAVTMLAATLGVRAACDGLGVPPATYYRRKRAKLALRKSVDRPSPPLALSACERNKVVTLLDSPRFADKAPAAIYAELLDEGRYVCSIRTMYRLLALRGEVCEWHTP